MKTNLNPFQRRFIHYPFFGAVLICLGLAGASPALAANKTWSGDGADNFWTTPANWVGGVQPAPGDSLFFGGTKRLVNTNDFGADISFDNITFTSPAGAFTLAGNEIDLAGNLTNDQVVTPEMISLPLVLTVPATADVVPNGELDLSGVLSGTASLTLEGGGLLNLSGANTFTGGLTLDAGIAVVGADANIGPGNLTLSGGTLETTAGFTLNPSRGITVGPGQGGIDVLADTTLSYSGIISGVGGLTKSGYGTLVLSGANTYTGPTTNAIGFLNLDFSGATTADVINSASSVTLGGGNASGAAGGGENVAQLNLAGGSGADTQSFAGVHATFGGSVLIATNGSGGSMNVSLGALSHDPGGALYFVTPEASGGGHVTTTSPNVNGILGGWALISGDANSPTIFHQGGSTSGNHNNGVAHNLVTGTNFASVDVSGNIVNYTGYSNIVASAGTVASQVAGAAELPNLSIDDTASPTVVNVDTDNAGTVNNVNTIKWTTSSAGYDGISIGAGNTLRLGRYGGIIRNGPNTSSGHAVYIGGPNGTSQSGNGTTGYGDIGTLTAGGADNTPGEIVIVANNPSETSGTTIIESTIADNGTGPVTVVKMGPGSIKLDGHNTFSGGLYLLQGRVQWAGAEIGNANPDGGGTGPIYVLPGSYIFPTGTGGAAITNAFFVAGGGDAAEAFGVFRGGTYTGPITLIGDTTIGCDVNVFDGSIAGPFNLTIGCLSRNGTVTLAGANDNWTGDTTLSGGGTSSPHNTFINGANEVIPNGFGYGNVAMDVGNAGTITWNLNGFNETINGLATSGNANDANAFIENTAAGTTSTLTIGDNNQSGTFGGLVEDAGGQVALTKIGGGVETLTGANTYSGPTVVSNGVLAVSDPGSISGSTNIQVNTGGTLDISGVSAGFSTTYPLQLDGGTMIGNAAVGGLTMNDGALTLDLDPSTVNVSAASLTTGGTTNLINISSVFGVTGYPAEFTVIQYSGTLGGAGNDFGIGTVPNSDTVGYVSNDVADSRIVLVLLNGPKVLTWTGTDPVSPANWDVGVTTNWIEFKGAADAAPSAFHQADSTIFDDTGSTTNIAVINKASPAEPVSPGFIEITNNTLTYTFMGSGNLDVSADMIKDGTGTAIVDNGGNNSLNVSGLLSINNGTLQVGNNDANGFISAKKGVLDNGTLVFDRSDSTTNNSNISGAGSVAQINTNTLTLGGTSTFSGGVNVAPGGTVKAGSSTALGVGTITISSGATLDVNGQTITNPVVVSGSGVDGLGAIVNSGAQDLNALLNVTLAGDTTFGGTSRWDIRGTGAQLSTSGNAYNLTKTGPNFISLAGVSVDSALANINVQEGTLEINSTTTLGNSADTLTVSPGATLQLYGAGSLSKAFVLNGTGTNTTLSCANGIGNAISGSTVTLNGNCVFNASGGTTLTFSGCTLGGGGSYLQIGAGTYVIDSGSTATYAGSTTVSNGTLLVDGSLSGGVQVDPGATLAGKGTASGSVSVHAGTVSPGDVALIPPQGTLTLGALTLSNATVRFDLDTTPSSSLNDMVAINNALTLDGTNTLEVNPLSFMSVGDIYTLMTYTGTTLPSSAANQLKVVSTRPFFSFAVVDPSTTPGAIEIQVLAGVGNDVWTGANSSTWDTNTINWTRNSSPVAFLAGDVANFDDTSPVTNVSLSGTLPTSDVNVNGTQIYTFGGTGALTGPGGLNVNGNELIVANAGANRFTGPITIGYSSLLQVGNGGTNGNLGSGILTNNNSLVFDRSDNGLVISNIITGPGSLTNTGPGTVTLAGANSFEGSAVVAQGTLRILNNSALGDPAFSSTYVSNGASLDFGANNVEVGAQPIYASGPGVGGNGAITDGSGSGGYGGGGGNFYNLTMLGDTSIGGSGRMDMRNTSATPTLFMSPIGSPYTLNKVGSDLFQMVNVEVDPGLGDINVMGGTLGVQGTFIEGLGNSSSNLTVFSGATFGMYDMATVLNNVLVLKDGGTVAGQHGNDLYGGPVILLGGTNIFSVTSGSLAFNNGLSGPGSLDKTGGSPLILSNATETYTGNTYIDDGTLALSGTATIATTPAVFLGGHTLDASATTAGLFELFAGQSLFNGGTVVGPLLADAGSSLNPGNGSTTAQLKDATSITMNGNVLMDLDRTNALPSDEMVSPSFAASGTLTVTNLGPDLETGDRFQLFSTNVTGFTAVNLPAKSASGSVSYTWQDNIATDGSITVLSGAPHLTPPNLGVSVSSGSLNLSWPPDHLGWTLETNAVGVADTNAWFSYPGSDTTTNEVIAIDRNTTNVFFRLTYTP